MNFAQENNISLFLARKKETSINQTLRSKGMSNLEETIFTTKRLIFQICKQLL